MSEATEVQMVCVDCGGTLTNDDMIYMASRHGEYEHMNYSGCIASLNERLAAATQRAEAERAVIAAAKDWAANYEDGGAWNTNSALLTAVATLRELEGA